MDTGKKRKQRGRIILVQEDRFCMVDAKGRGYLFTLGHQTRASQEDLNRWHQADIEVVVQYAGEPNLASGIAHQVEPYRLS